MIICECIFINTINVGYRKRLLLEWFTIKEKGGVSQREFARSKDVGESTFRSWVKNKKNILKFSIDCRERYNLTYIPFRKEKEEIMGWLANELRERDVKVDEFNNFICKNFSYLYYKRSYCSRKEFCRRYFNLTYESVHGFLPIEYNEYVSLLKNVDNRKRAFKCKCVMVCANECKNKMQRVECDVRNCNVGFNCGNRYVTHRFYPSLEKFETEGKGYGIKTNELISKGSLVSEYIGEVVDTKTKIHRSKEGENAYIFMIQKNMYIDSRRKGNISRFFNHSCKFWNLKAMKWEVMGRKRIIFEAQRDIKKGEELLFNYGEDYRRILKLVCKCSFCEKKKAVETD